MLMNNMTESIPALIIIINCIMSTARLDPLLSGSSYVSEKSKRVNFIFIIIY